MSWNPDPLAGEEPELWAWPVPPSAPDDRPSDDDIGTTVSSSNSSTPPTPPRIDPSANKPPFRFFDLPAELRADIFSYLVNDFNSILFNHQLPHHNSFYLKTTTASGEQAHQRMTSYLLANKQMRNEFLDADARASEWEFRISNCWEGPRTSHAKDEQARRIMQLARVWSVKGCMKGEMKAGDEEDYGVQIRFGRGSPNGYVLVWRHLDMGRWWAAGVDDEVYWAMVKRVEEAFAAAVALREKMDGKRGLCLEGLDGIVDAFYLDHQA